jgi:hypothetical protein
MQAWAQYAPNGVSHRYIAGSHWEALHAGNLPHFVAAIEDCFAR